MKKLLSLLIILCSLYAYPSPARAEEPPFTIIAGDVLQITVWKEDGLDREVLVLQDGTITFPLIGTLSVQGKTPNDVQANVKEKLAKLIPEASVTVAVKAALGHTVNVIGQVVKPGEIVMGRRLTAIQALSQAGGLTPYASEGNIIVLRRNGSEETTIKIPYSDIIKGRKLDQDILLNPGDVVVVPTAGLL
ncbi:MAG: polysaccharide biosynthesis/export family protein [Bdellovibrionales bacterium]